MHPGRIVAILAIGASTVAQAGPSAVPRSVVGACGDAVKGATKAAQVGAHTTEVDYQVWLPGGRALVSVLGGGADDPCGGGPQCRVFPVGRAAASATGAFGAGGASVKAFVLPVARCTEDECASILAIRAPAAEDKVLDAIRLPDGCEAALAPLALVPGQSSLKVTCSQVAAGGDTESVLVFHVVNGVLTPVISFEAGTTEIATPDEAKAGSCTIGPVGGAVVVKGAGGPRLRVTRAPDGGQSTGDGDGPACKRQKAIEQDYRWDAAQQQLVEDGPGRPIVKDTCKCKR